MAKPPFDPNKPFTASQGGGQKPAFNPNAPYEDATQLEAVAPKSPEESGGIMSGIGDALEVVDSYTGAPVRSAIGAAQQGENPFTAFGAQFGEDTTNAPTGKEIAMRAGVPDTSLNQGMTTYTNPKSGITIPISNDDAPSVADVAGFGVDATADLTNLIPGGLIAKGVSRGAKGVRGLKNLGRAGKIADETTATARASGTAKASAEVAGGAQTAEQGGQLFEFKAPQSLEELRQWNPKGKDAELISFERLGQIEKSVPDLDTKPLNYHYDMLQNPKSMKELKLKFENLPTADAQKIAAYNQQMVNEATEKITDTVYAIGKSEPKALSDAGYDFIETAKGRYLGEKEQLGPMFDELRVRSRALNQDASKDLIVNLSDNSKLKKLLVENPETGKFGLKKNTPRTGLSDKEHKVLSRLIDDLNDGMTFEEMQSTREFMRKAIDPMNPAETAEIGKVRSMMLGQMEKMAGGLGDDVGNVFKQYAINEKSREAVEKIIGGKIDSLDVMYAANPDRVVKKIFSNPNHADIVRGYVGDAKMDELVSSYIGDGLRRATDSVNGFSPYKFKTWLKTNQSFLSHNLDEKTFERLSAMTDYGVFGRKFLQEVNPSGTAASLKEMIEPRSFMQKIHQQGPVSAVTSEVAGRVNSVINRKGAQTALDSALKGKNAAEKVGRMSKMADGIAKPMDKAAEAIKRGMTPAKVTHGGAKATNIQAKGPDKWVNTGVDRLVEATGNQAFESLRQSTDKNTRKLLMQISSAKPGSKMFKALMKKLETKVGDQ